MKKKCSKCKLPKLLDEFNKRVNSKDGYRFECRICQKAHYKSKRDYYISLMKRNRLIKLDEYVKRDKINYNKNIDKILAKKKIYHIENRTHILKRTKEYYIKNKDKKDNYNKKWVRENINHIRNYHNNYSKKYNRLYPHKIIWRSILKSSLKRLGKTKEGHTIDLLGFSALDLKNHISSLFTEGMSWSNYGEWHIDHIKRVRDFDKDTLPSIVNALSNLRPLWATTREINGITYEGNLNRAKR